MTDNFDKSTILDSFLDEVTAYLPEIEANLDRLQQSPGDTEALEETYRRAHTIGGSAAMMDFPALAHVAQGMEEILSDALERSVPLSGATIALLRRSHGRLSRLVEHVRSGADDAPVVTEDDADRSAWRGTQPGGMGGFDPSASGQRSQPGFAGAASQPGVQTGIATSPGLQAPEWMAAFAAPPAVPAQTPPASLSDFADMPTGAPPVRPDLRAFDALDAFDAFNAFNAFDANNGVDAGADIATMRTSAMQAVQPSRPGLASSPSNPPSNFAQPTWDASQPATIPIPPTSSQPNKPATQTALSASVVDELYSDEEAVRRQVGTLQDIVAQLREAAQAMDDERTELTGFLDGSQDALDRLETWAGQQMGLDLPSSPDAVRRYLPLSVIWVTTARLKRLVALLHGSSRSLTLTQEQADETLNELRAAIRGLGQISGYHRQDGRIARRWLQRNGRADHLVAERRTDALAGGACRGGAVGARRATPRTRRRSARRNLRRGAPE